MDEWADGWTIQTDGWTDRQLNGWAFRNDRRADELTGRYTDGQMDVQMDRLMDAQTDRQVDE